jgi:hypothetical protein
LSILSSLFSNIGETHFQTFEPIFRFLKVYLELQLLLCRDMLEIV